MNESSPAPEPADHAEPDAKGPNLVLIYVLLAAAILGSIAFAAMIVWPFYLRR